MLTVQGAMARDVDFKQTLCADIDGFSLHAAVRCGADDRQAEDRKFKHPSFSRRPPVNAPAHPLVRSFGSAAAC